MTGQADRRHDAFPARGASLETRIDWLRDQRLDKPLAPLCDLIGGRRIELTQLIDLACVDLIEQHRSGHSVGAESYVSQFPELARNDLLLDLIDAEICVTHELQQPIDRQQYARRFPELIDDVNELLGMQEPPSIVGASGSRPELESPNFPDTAVFPDTSVSAIGDHPLDAPEWFSTEKCFASGPGRWLIRGRDTSSGAVMAMKVIDLPSLSADQSRRLLDACEVASKVRHPVFVPPTLAAIQRGHLGVIRPWVFGIAWAEVAAKRDVATQLHELASLAYCLEAVRRSGAAHGGIHPENVLIDHDGNLRLVDAAASCSGLRRWLEPAERARDPVIAMLPRPQLQRQDIDDLVRLVTSASEHWRKPWTNRLLEDIKAITDGSQELGADDIGDILMRYADSPPSGTFFQSWFGE